MAKTGEKRSKISTSDTGNGSAKRGRGRPRKHISVAAAQLLTKAPQVLLRPSTSDAPLEIPMAPSPTISESDMGSKPRGGLFRVLGNDDANAGPVIALAAAQLIRNAPEVLLQGSPSDAPLEIPISTHLATIVQSADQAPSVVEITSSGEEEDDRVETKLRQDPLSLLFVPLHRGTNHIYSGDQDLSKSVKSVLLTILKSNKDVFTTVQRSNLALKLLEEADVEYASFYDGYKKILEYRWTLETAGTPDNDVLESLEKDYGSVMLDEHSCRERIEEAEQRLMELQQQQDHWKKVLQKSQEAHKLLDHQMHSVRAQVDQQKAAKEVKEKTLNDIREAIKRLEEMIKV